MSIRVEKAGSHRFKPVSRASGQQDDSVENRPVATPIRPPKGNEPQPLPIARRPSVTSNSAPSINVGASSASSSTGASKNATKSYLGVKGGGSGGSGGIPIFPGGSSSRAGSMAPPTQPNTLRRSQTPQFSASRASVPRETPSTPSRSLQQLAPAISQNSASTIEQPEASRRHQRATQSTRSAINSVSVPSQAIAASSPSATSIAPPSQAAESVEQPASANNGKSKAITRKPANPPTAYVLFSQSIRPRLLDEAATPEGASFNVNQRVREEWTALSQAEKKVYQDDAARRKQTWQSLMDDWIAENPDEAAKSQSGKRKARQSTEGAEPARDAYKIFCDEYKGKGDVEEAWKVLTSRQRQKYELQAQKEEEEYLDRMLNEEGNANGVKTKRQKARTVSDDEAEYEAEVAQYGPGLKAKRIDTRTTAMSDLSGLQFRKGRASKRTFELERKLKEQTRERQRQLKRNKAARERGEEVAEDEEQNGDTEMNGVVKSQSQQDEPEEEIIDEGEEEDTAAQSDGESVGAASEIGPPLRDNRFTVRTRIVDGKIVLDETSLQQERGNAAEMDGRGQEYIDVNEEDRFVNSATYSKRVGTERWDAKETQAFLKAVSMWGSDFEMISRMFPNRNRKQIRAKWRSMERTDSRSLDLAFRRKLPVSLEEYGLMAGVDLSGEAPLIEAKMIKQLDEEVGERSEQQVEREVEIERDEEGREIVDEGDARMITRNARKKSVTPARLAKSKSPSITAETDHEDDEEGEELPTGSEAVRNAISRRSRNERESSMVSTTSHRERTRGSSTVATPAAESERLRQVKKVQDQQRKEREQRRRRSVPINEEEVLD